MTAGAQPDHHAIMRVRPGDPGYAADAAAEAEFWAQPHLFGIGLPDAAFADGPFDRYTNRRFTGDPHTRWFDTIVRYGTFTRALILGAASLDIEARLLETHPALHITLCDISAGAIATHAEALNARFPGRADARVMDLNFAELPPAAFDLCVSTATLHHITNLEWLAAQVHHALAAGGYFFLQDYVGEPRFHFTPAKRRVFEAILARDVAERPERSTWTMAWPEDSDTVYSPFEAIRADETLPVLQQQFETVHLRTAGAMSGLFLFRRRAAARRASIAVRALARLRRPADDARLRRFQQDVMLIDEVLCDSGALQPNNAFGVFRKPPA